LPPWLFKNTKRFTPARATEAPISQTSASSVSALVVMVRPVRLCWRAASAVRAVPVASAVPVPVTAAMVAWAATVASGSPGLRVVWAPGPTAVTVRPAVTVVPAVWAVALRWPRVPAAPVVSVALVALVVPVVMVDRVRPPLVAIRRPLVVMVATAALAVPVVSVARAVRRSSAAPMAPVVPVVPAVMPAVPVTVAPVVPGMRPTPMVLMVVPARIRGPQALVASGARPVPAGPVAPPALRAVPEPR
jgi:hypothetical protein